MCMALTKTQTKLGCTTTLWLSWYMKMSECTPQKYDPFSLKKLNGWAFNLAAFLGNIKLLWMVAAEFFNMMAEFERKHLKIHFYKTTNRGHKTLQILIAAVVPKQRRPAFTERQNCSFPSHHRSIKSRQTQNTLRATLPQGPTVSSITIETTMIPNRTRLRFRLLLMEITYAWTPVND